MRRSATAAVAYRTGERIVCEREGRVHDYRARAGVEVAFIVAPDDAPDWAQDRQRLWNAAEARETRVNSVTAREGEADTLGWAPEVKIGPVDSGIEAGETQAADWEGRPT